MVLSKFVKIFKVEDSYAYYNSLKMKPVYLTENEHTNLHKYLDGNIYAISNDLEDVLKQYRILVDQKTDDNILSNIQSSIPEPYISVAYFILSEQCNLACKYCFLGNGNIKNKNKVTTYPMSKETAKSALLYFSNQTKVKKEYFNDRKEIIFYGGEPLINFDTLKYIVEECKLMQRQGDISSDTNFSMVTNGLLLDEDKIDFLKENNVSVSISIDGIDETSNKNRVDKNGLNIYPKIISVLDLLKKKQFRVSLSITLTEDTLNSAEDILHLAEIYNISAISFNLLLKADGFHVSNDYYERASLFIIEFYKLARTHGIYEDRIMRKINSFVNAELYPFDCAATSSNQIVITPDGGIGICHGCMENRDFFISNVDDINVDLSSNNVLKGWQAFSPIFKEKCINCECLGICGGGCPVNAGLNHNINMDELIDEGFCTYAKNVLKFMINDLYNIISDGENN